MTAMRLLKPLYAIGLYRWRLLLLFDGVVVELCAGLGVRTDLKDVSMPRTKQILKHSFFSTLYTPLVQSHAIY